MGMLQILLLTYLLTYRTSSCTKIMRNERLLEFCILEDDGDDERVSEDTEKEEDRINDQQEVDMIATNASSSSSSIFVAMLPSRVRHRCVQLFYVFQVNAGNLHHTPLIPCYSTHPACCPSDGLADRLAYTPTCTAALQRCYGN